ncbi:MAG: proteasome activator [Acidimicrobiia bacterium]|nr:proteasome activator [Acidimicrobiia bacterium]
MAEAAAGEAISQPAKVMRVGSMVKQLLEEVRQTDLDEEARTRLRDLYHRAVDEVGGALSDDLREELESFSVPFLDSDRIPTEAELRVAQAQLVGWLEGLFTGIQATLFAQQMAARQQLEQMRGELPPGAQGPPGGSGQAPPGARPPGPGDRPGTYL